MVSVVYDLGNFGGSQHLLLIVTRGLSLAIPTSVNTTTNAVGMTLPNGSAPIVQVIACWTSVKTPFTAGRGMVRVIHTDLLPFITNTVNVELDSELAPADGGFTVTWDVYVLALGTL